MIAYASRTGTRRTLRALANADWRLMISAKGVHRHEGFGYAIDNGAWWSFVNKQPFDSEAFQRLYDQYALDADFVVLPDIVADGDRSLGFSMEWHHKLGIRRCPQYLAVQDGMDFTEIENLCDKERFGIFVGGSTDWKLQTMAEWGRIGLMIGVPVHVGRVNTVRRIALCAAAGVKSFDGSSVSRYLLTLPRLDVARHQPDMFAYAHHCSE